MKAVPGQELATPAELEARLRAIGAERYHHRHPFHQLMHEGKLTRGQLQAWALNRYYYKGENDATTRSARPELDPNHSSPRIASPQSTCGSMQYCPRAQSGEIEARLQRFDGEYQWFSNSLGRNIAVTCVNVPLNAIFRRVPSSE